MLAKRHITNTPDTRVVSTPHKSDLINRHHVLKVQQMQLVDVSPPKQANPEGRVLLWKVRLDTTLALLRPSFVRFSLVLCAVATFVCLSTTCPHTSSPDCCGRVNMRRAMSSRP